MTGDADATDIYELMGVEPDASKDEIKEAYRRRLEDLKFKAETGRSDKIRDAARAETKQLNAAWQVLSDPFQRQRYDDALAAGDSDDADADAETTVPGPARGLRRLFEPRPRPEPKTSSSSTAPAKSGAREPRARSQRRPAEGVPGAEAAPLGRRMAAMGIDLAVVGALYLGIVNLAAIVFDPDDQTTPYIATVITAVFAFFAVYFVAMTARTGQTFGKRLVHIMAVDAESGELPTWTRAGLRYIVPIVFLLGLPGSLGALLALFFGFSWALLDTRVGLMDRLGHTRVVLAQYTPARPTP
jgi:uncharacterized RDD family membrane protein YckC